MTFRDLAALALLAIMAGAVIGLQAGRPQVVQAKALPEPSATPPAPTSVPSSTNQPEPTPAPGVTNQPEPTDPPLVIQRIDQSTDDSTWPEVIPDTGDPFIWGPRAYHVAGFPERVWFTKQGRSGELAAELLAMIRGETLEFGAGMYELKGMYSADESEVWAAFLPSDLSIITSTGYNASTGEWKYRVVFLFREVGRGN